MTNQRTPTFNVAADAPLVSIVVPAFNVGRFLDQTLSSIQSQTESQWECVVVDDGSVDDTLAIARAYASEDSRFRVLAQSNAGASAARNAGFRATRPDTRYVCFMDSDDVWLPFALSTLLERAESRPECIGAHGLADFINATGQMVDPGTYADVGRARLGLEGRRLIEWPLDRPTTFNVLANGNVLFPPGLVLARRSAYESVGPFDERFNGPEDWDMLIRLSRVGPIDFVDRVILLYRRHESNLGANPDVARQAWLVRCKAFYSDANSPAQARAVRAGWRAYQGRLLSECLEAMSAHLRRGEVIPAFVRGVEAVAALLRWLRGRPMPKVTSIQRQW